MNKTQVKLEAIRKLLEIPASPKASGKPLEWQPWSTFPWDYYNSSGETVLFWTHYDTFYLGRISHGKLVQDWDSEEYLNIIPNYGWYWMPLEKPDD